MPSLRLLPALALAATLLTTLGTSPAHAATTAVHGLVVVTSGPLESPAGVQKRGFVDCPRGFVPLGGGAFLASPAANLNGSFPTSRSWIVDVNNPTAAATTFDIHLVCARKPKLYSLVTSGFLPDPT